MKCPICKMEREFPKAWAYLQEHKEMLRSRVNSKFDISQWYRFGRSQNLDKQDFPKLIVAQRGPCMRVCFVVDGALASIMCV